MVSSLGKGSADPLCPFLTFPLPEAQAGSTAALWHLLTAMGKPVSYACPDPMYRRLQFLFEGCESAPLPRPEEGTVITEVAEPVRLPPILINKDNQCLLTLTPRDFSFIAEEKLSRIFAVLAKYKLKLNLMQNSAISFSFCVDGNGAQFEAFIRELQEEFEVLYNRDVRLITIRHYTEAVVREIVGDRMSLVEQRSRLTAQFVIQN